MDTMRIIKKYPNRRLYDTELGTYITLDDVKKLVFEHINFQVIDARTQKDLTQSTLLQIIAEQEATETPLFTTNVLQDFIRFYNERSQTIFSKYLEEVMQMYQQQKHLVEEQWNTYQNLVINPQFLQQVTNFQKMWGQTDKKEHDEEV